MPDHLSLTNAPDATEQVVHLQSELDQLRGELEHSQRLATLGVMAAGIAHEINNLLTPVLAYAQLASNHPDDKNFQAKALDKAVTGVQTATQIVQAMLGFASKSEQEELANVGEAIRASFDCIGRDPTKDRIKLQIDVDSNVWVKMKSLALQQVLINLILNAHTAIGKRGGSLQIAAYSSGSSTTITISDSGPGIPAPIAAKVFEPFVTGTATTRGKSRKPAGSSGTGLGLAICKRLVEDARGRISVNSVPGRGTTFTITLAAASAKRAAG